MDAERGLKAVRRIRHRRVARLALVACAASLSACGAASTYVYTPPSVALRNVVLNGIGLTGGSLRVSLVVRNPNFYPLSTTGLQYRLLVHDSIPVAQGVDSTRRRVPAHDSAVVELPMEVTWRGLSAAGSDIVASGLVTYRFVGDIMLDTPLGVHRVPMNQTGRFAPLR
jgi:LEA14-like dessication related protein